MDPGFLLLSTIQAGSAVLCVGIIAWAIVAFARARHGKVITGTLSAASLQPLEARMERLEQATEAIALQVERVAEGQRFVTKLLAQDDKAQAALPSGGNERDRR